MKKIILFFVAIIFISCQEEKKVETDNTPISKVKDLANSFKTDKLQTFEFILKEDTLFTGKEGTKIFIPKDLFENYTNGKITFELKEFYTKEDIILNGLSTITDKDELLESSGMFYINFKEEGKQLNIKKGKNYKVEVANKPLSNSNIYYNDNDSIFRWKLSDEKIFTEIPDIVRNLKLFLSPTWKYDNIPDKYFKTVNLDSIKVIKKKDSIEYYRLLEIENKRIVQENEIFWDNNWDKGIEDEKLTPVEKIAKRKKLQKIYNINNELYSFSSNKLGWINIDKILNVEVEKEIYFTIRNKEELDIYYVSYVYLNNNTVLNDFLNNKSLKSYIKISGKIKAIIYTSKNEKIYYDTFYIDINSKPNFELNLKETTLEKLKQELVTP
ncbi:hypothetical protein [Flavobacterium sp.]|uniref:hypothetical protein n=1 Tax=Flavobacterium sp. TaxID=239 RepID=UPI003F6A3B7F